MDDAELVYIIRFERESVRNSTSKNIPSLKEHRVWFEDHKGEYFIYEDKAYVRIESNGFVSIGVKKEYRDKGIAKKLLKDLKSGKAIILNDNNASLVVFLKAGFKIKGLYLEKDD